VHYCYTQKQCVPERSSWGLLSLSLTIKGSPMNLGGCQASCQPSDGQQWLIHCAHILATKTQKQHFQVSLGTSKVFRGYQSNLYTSSVDSGVQGEAHHELCVLHRMLNCWSPHIQSERYATYTSANQ